MESNAVVTDDGLNGALASEESQINDFNYVAVDLVGINLG